MTSEIRGFSLIEVLIAMFLISVGLTGLLRLQVYMEQKSDVAEKSQQALYLAENWLEQLRAYPELKVQRTELVRFRQEDAEEFTLSTKVAMLETGYAERIQVRVEWSDRAGESRHVTLETVIAKTSQ